MAISLTIGLAIRKFSVSGQDKPSYDCVNDPLHPDAFADSDRQAGKPAVSAVAMIEGTELGGPAGFESAGWNGTQQRDIQKRYFTIVISFRSNGEA